MKLTTAAFTLLLGAGIALAHHSFMAEFDQRKPINIDGVVTKIDWINPHATFYVETKDEAGNAITWALQTGSPNALISRGWTRESMKIGDHVTVQAYRAKTHDKLAAARCVTLADGRTVFGGQTDDGGPEK